ERDKKAEAEIEALVEYVMTLEGE
ncbi:AAA family ATPase, partial [Klebsiella pneumoniae]